MKTMVENPDKNTFIPCRYCSNILTEECMEDWTETPVSFNHFRLRPGTSIKDLPPFPLQAFLHQMDVHWRMTTVGIYLAIVTDYLQHKEEYDERDNLDHSRGGAISQNVEKQSVPDGAKTEDPLHPAGKERPDPGV